MSKGRYRMMWTILAELMGYVLSYVYGLIVPAWFGSWLPKPLSIGTLRLYEHFIALLSLPRFLQLAFLSNTGSIWLTIAILFRLVYLLQYVRSRAQSKEALPNRTLDHRGITTGRRSSGVSGTTVRHLSAGSREFH